MLAFFLRSIFLFPISFGDNTPRSDRRTRVGPHCRILCPCKWNDAILEEAGVLVQFKCVTWSPKNINMPLTGPRPHLLRSFWVSRLLFSPSDLNLNQSRVTICSQRNCYDFASNAASPECPLQRNHLGTPLWSMGPPLESGNPKDPRSFQRPPRKSCLGGMQRPVIWSSRVSHCIFFGIP